MIKIDLQERPTLNTNDLITGMKYWEENLYLSLRSTWFKCSAEVENESFYKRNVKIRKISSHCNDLFRNKHFNADLLKKEMIVHLFYSSF